MNNCPCNKCICVPVCKRKQYQFLVNDCKEIWSYLKNPFDWSVLPSRSNARLKIIHKTLKPTSWSLFYSTNDKVMVDNYTGYENCHLHY